MKTELNSIIEKISESHGTISLLNLSRSEIASLQDQVIWTYSDNKASNAVVRFGDSNFRPKGAKKGLIIDTGFSQYDYELKAMMLLLRHTGIKEGGKTYKWQSIPQRIRTLAKFAKYCANHNVVSFFQISELPELKLRNLLFGYLHDDVASGGMNIAVQSSNAKTFRDGLKHLKDFQIVTHARYRDLIDEFTLGKINKHEDEHRLKHTIIPTGLMKRFISEATSYVEAAKAQFPRFSEINRLANSKIHLSKSANPKHALRTANHKDIKEMTRLLNTYYKDLSRHTYALVLAFTGMRNSEAYALKNDCGVFRREGAEDLYFVKSLLSKTDDGAIELDWVANELVYDAVVLLSEVNAIYHERAVLMLEHHKHNMSDLQIHRIQYGLIDNRLFGIRHTVAYPNFTKTGTGCDENVNLSLGKYRYQVFDEDIQQLETLECNYQSVSANSGMRGKPYRIGDYFNFTPHQFRHTFAWFIIANRLGDLDDIKYQFKHLTRAMTLVYSERGFESLSELRSVIEYFENYANQRAIEDIVQSSLTANIAGGGGERLAKLINRVNDGSSEIIYSTDHQPHFESVRELVAFTTRHSDSIRGLPHGYCTKGPACKIKNAADPSHCLYCDTYYATAKHLPYWRSIKAGCEVKLEKIDSMTEERKSQFQAFRSALEDNLLAADKIIGRLSTNRTEVEAEEVI